MCVHLKAAHKGQSRGAAPGIFSATRCLSLLSEGKLRAGDEEGTKERGGDVGGPPVFESCHVALIHPVSLESGKGPESLS